MLKSNRMKLPQISLALIFLFLTNNTWAQTLTPEKFREKIGFFVKDATTGFQSTIGEYIEITRIGRRYTCNNAVANSKEASIYYSPENYRKYAGETDPETFRFVEDFKTDTEDGKIVKENVELVFDQLAESMDLYKDPYKYKKKIRHLWREVAYRDRKTLQIVLFFLENVEASSISLSIYSDLRPTDLPKYNGCMVLYNIQSGNIVSAIALYVYGDGFESESKMYSNSLAKMSATSASYYGSYDYMPGASERKVEAKLDALGITYATESIDNEGYKLSHKPPTKK